MGRRLEVLYLFVSLGGYLEGRRRRLTFFADRLVSQRRLTDFLGASTRGLPQQPLDLREPVEGRAVGNFGRERRRRRLLEKGEVLLPAGGRLPARR
jgi:hypothetical protein